MYAGAIVYQNCEINSKEIINNKVRKKIKKKNLFIKGVLCNTM